LCSLGHWQIREVVNAQRDREGGEPPQRSRSQLRVREDESPGRPASDGPSPIKSGSLRKPALPKIASVEHGSPSSSVAADSSREPYVRGVLRCSLLAVF
jgi:hypothetical protein